MLSSTNNFIINEINSILLDIENSEINWHNITITINDNLPNKYLIYNKEKYKWNLFNNNDEKIKIKRNYSYLKKCILNLLNGTVNHPNKHIYVQTKNKSSENYEIYKDLFISKIVHIQNESKFDKFFRVQEDGLKNVVCDGENKKHSKMLYKQVNNFVDDIKLVNIIDEYYYFCETTKISGKMFEIKGKYENFDLIIYYLETSSDQSDDKGYVMGGGTLLFKIDNNDTPEIICKLSVLCGHPYIWYKDYGGWCGSHGESDFPYIDLNNLDNLQKAFNKIINKLLKYSQ